MAREDPAQRTSPRRGRSGSAVQWPEIYRCEEFGRRMALNVTANTCVFLDEVDDAILDLEARPRTRREVVEALRHRYSPKRIVAAFGRLDKEGIFSTRAAPLATETYGPPKAITLTLNVSQSCNLRCKYCYIDGELLSARRQMSADVARRAVDLVLERHADAERLGISFYGGEPLLNFPTVRSVMHYADRRASELGMPPVEYHLSTNGTCVTEAMVDFLAGQNVEVLVSLDGPARIHDAMRLDARGRATHARVMRSVRRLLAGKSVV